MADPRLLGIGRAVPERRYTQRELHEQRPWADNALFDRLFLDSPIRSRGLYVPPEWYRVPRTLTDTNRAWREGALSLGGAALREALARTSTGARELDLVAVTSVTGYATPGLDLLLVDQEGLRDDVARAHFNCIGCHAAIPLLKVAADHVALRPGSRAVALAVEICSACFSSDDDPQNLVALSLFGDGAAAAIVGSEGDGPRIVDFGAKYDLAHLDALGFGLTMGGFRIVLDPAIPQLIASSIEATVDALLAKNDVSREQVSTWCFHPGGSRILDEVERRLGLSPSDLAASRSVLADHGNMRSPSVLFVLAEAMRAGRPPRGSYGVLAAFGPGLGIETMLIAFG